MNVKRTHRGTLGRAGGAQMLDRLDGDDDDDPRQAAKKAQLQAVREVMRERQRKDTAKRREMQREAARSRGTTAPGGNTGGNATIQQQHEREGYPAAEEGDSRRNGYNQQHGVHCGSSNGVNLPIHDDGVHYNCGMGSGDGRVGSSAHRLPFFDDDDDDGAVSLRERYPWWFTEDMALEEFNLDWRDPDTVQMLLDLEAEIMAEERSQVVGADVEEDADGGDTAPYVHHHEEGEEDYGTSVALAMYESCYGGGNQDEREQHQNSIDLGHSTLNQHSPYTGPQQPTPTPTYRAVNTARWNADSSKQMTVPQVSQFPQLPPSVSAVLPLQPPPPTGSSITTTTSTVEADDDDDKDWEEYYRSMH